MCVSVYMRIRAYVCVVCICESVPMCVVCICRYVPMCVQCVYVDICLCGGHMYRLCMCMCVRSSHWCVNVWKPEEGVRSLALSTSALFP